jgi:regulator of sigma E protease
MAILLNILIMLLILGVLITVHEFGHFIAAKLVDAKVEEFSIGLGPKVWSKKRGETEYMLKLLPIGGYVKILGEVEESKDPRSLLNKGKLQRLFVFLAGVIMNFLLAVLIYYLFMFLFNFQWALPSGYEDYDPKFGDVKIERVSDLMYSEVLEEGGANDANWPEKGEITQIGDLDISYSYELREALDNYRGGVIEIGICVDEECSIYPTEISEKGTVGISLYENYVVYLDYTGIRGLSGFAHSVNFVDLAVDQLSKRVSDAKESGNYEEVANSVAGPVGVYIVVEEFAKYGFGALLGLTADLSLTLAVMNILPIPALDGGRVLLLGAETLYRKRLPRRLEAFLINGSFILLLLIMLGIIVKDIVFFDSLRSVFE